MNGPFFMSREIKDEIYGIGFRICGGGESQHLYRRLHKEYDVVVDNGNYFAYCIALTADGKMVVVIHLNEIDWTTTFYRALVHECMHAVHKVMDYVGMTLTNESQEAYAYYIDWVFTECIYFYKQKTKGKAWRLKKNN